MNCCDDYGKCKQGHGCPARETKETKMTHTTESLMALRKLAESAKKSIDELADMTEAEFNACHFLRTTFRRESAAKVIELLDALEARDRRIAELEAEIADVKQVQFPEKLRRIADVWKKKCDTLRTQLDALRVQESVTWEGAEGWEPLAWQLCAEENGEESCNKLIWEGGAIPEPWGDRWLKYEDEAKRLIELVRKYAAPVAPAQLAELQSGDELPELPPMRKLGEFYDGSPNNGYLWEDLQSYARQAQALARAKLLAELGKVEPAFVMKWTWFSDYEGSWDIQQEPALSNRPEGATLNLYTRPLPAQDVNAELIEALEAVLRMVTSATPNTDVMITARTALANDKAAQQKEQK